MPANLLRFLAGFDTYDQLHRWSVHQPEEFWPAVWRFCGVKSTRPWTEVRDTASGAWFPGATLNFAATLLRPNDDDPALLTPRRTFTHRDLSREVARTAKALQSAGIGPGHRIASLLPAIPEAVVALLAAASLGAVWLPLHPANPALAAPLQPLLLCTPDLPRLPEITAQLPSLRQVLVACLNHPSPSLAGLPRALRWQDSTAFFQGCLDPSPLPLPFDHPLVLLPGGPHAFSAGGLLLQFLKELVLHFDVHPESRVRVTNPANPACLLRAVTALAAGAALDLTAPGDWPEALLPASPLLPNPLSPASPLVPALGIPSGDGQACSPSFPLNWPA